jgi:hypothetical protein
MHYNPKTRAERREEQRVERKDFETLAKEVKQSVERAIGKNPDVRFKEAVLEALKHLEEGTEHANRRLGALLLAECVVAFDRQDELTASYLLYSATLVLNSELMQFSLVKLHQMFREFKD